MVSNMTMFSVNFKQERQQLMQNVEWTILIRIILSWEIKFEYLHTTKIQSMIALL